MLVIHMLYYLFIYLFIYLFYFICMHAQDVKSAMARFLPKAGDPLRKAVRERLLHRLHELRDTLMRSQFFWVS